MPLSYVDNCAEAICIAAERARFDGDVYNVHDDDLDHLRRVPAALPGRGRARPRRSLALLRHDAALRAVEWYHRHSRGQLPPIFTPYKTRTMWKGNRFSNAKLHGARLLANRLDRGRPPSDVRIPAREEEGRLAMLGAFRALRERHLETFFRATWSTRVSAVRARGGLRSKVSATCSSRCAITTSRCGTRSTTRHGARASGSGARATRGSRPSTATPTGEPPAPLVLLPRRGVPPGVPRAARRARAAGFGEVEIHLHHDGDTAETLEAQLPETHRQVHAPWPPLARCDGGVRGTRSSTATGRSRTRALTAGGAASTRRSRCSSGPAATPTSRSPRRPTRRSRNIVNRIYWPTGRSAREALLRVGRARPRRQGHDRPPPADPGPARAVDATRAKTLRSVSRTRRSRPRPAAPGARAATWVSRNIHVEGRPEWVFVKLHTHGAPELEAASLLGDGGHDAAPRR